MHDETMKRSKGADSIFGIDESKAPFTWSADELKLNALTPNSLGALFKWSLTLERCLG